MPVSATAIRSALRELDLSGQIVGLHSSLTSFGRVEGGAPALLGTILDEGCTVLAPTFSYQCEAPAPEGVSYERNGIAPGETPTLIAGPRRPSPFSTDSNLIWRREMGVIPVALLNTPGRYRGNHPLNSFSALGEWDDALLRLQQPLDVYAPLRALAAARGWVLLMGVDYRSLTLLHAAEVEAGRTLFRRWALAARTGIVECDVGSCSRGFNNFAPVLEPFERRLQVGDSLWRLLPASEALEAAAAAIREQPRITHCGREQCVRCDHMSQGGREA